VTNVACPVPASWLLLDYIIIIICSMYLIILLALFVFSMCGGCPASKRYRLI